MPFEKKIIKDRINPRPGEYFEEILEDGATRHVPAAPDTQVGTDLDAEHMQRYEDALEDHENRIGTQENETAELREKFEAPDFTLFSTSGSITSLPVGSLDGKVKGFEARGLTIVNNAMSASISDDVLPWYSGYTRGDLSIDNGDLINTENASSSVFQYFIQDTNVPVTENDVWFFYAPVVGESDDHLTFELRYFGDASSQLVDNIINPFQNQQYELHSKFVADNQGGSMKVFVRVENPSDQNGRIVRLNRSVGIFAINMTALGIEDYTEEKMLNLVRSGCFEGITNVENPVYESVWKNLSRTSSRSGDIDFETKEALVVSRRIERGTTYSLSFFNNTPCALRIITNNEDYTGKTAEEAWDARVETLQSSTPTGGQKEYLKTPLEADYLTVLMYGDTVDYENLILEEDRGQTLGMCVGYKSSKLKLNVPLRSVSSAFDRLYVRDGQFWLEKSVEEYVLQSEDVIGLVTTSTNYDRIGIQRSNIPNIYIQPAGVTQGKAIIQGFRRNEEYSVGGFDDVLSYVGTYIDSASGSSAIQLLVPKGRYANLTEVQSDLAGTVIHYELVNPQSINLTERGLVEGELESFENGTFYQSSDTFGCPSVSFEVPTDVAAQREMLIESANAQGKAIAVTQKMLSELTDLEVIYPTLLNGWSNYAPTTPVKITVSGRRYVSIQGVVNGGTVNSVMFKIPDDLKPSRNVGFMVYNDGALVGTMKVYKSNLEVKQITGSTTYFEFYIEYEVGE